MPTHPPAHDPADFAARLKEAMQDVGENIGRGAGVTLAKRYKTSTVTAHAWLTGAHMPSPDRARLMAEDLGVAFNWLYFGTGPKRMVVREAPAEYLSTAIELTPRERALLENYRAADDSTKSVVDAAAAAGAQHGNKPRGARKRA